MSKWKEYNGSPEQIAVIFQPKLQVAIKTITNRVFLLLNNTMKSDWLYDVEYCKTVREYLICNPHPLADMICQQARTGQPVWVRKLFECGIEKEWQMFVTTTPDWNIPGAEYSFTEFKEEVV